MDDLTAKIVLLTLVCWGVVLLGWMVYSALTSSNEGGGQQGWHGHQSQHHNDTGPIANVDGTPMHPGTNIDVMGRAFGSTDSFGQDHMQ